MPGTGRDSKPPGRRLAAAAFLAAFPAAVLPAATARAGDGLWDTMLETLNVKAPPPGPAPDFVERNRPDPGSLGYLPTALPHKVSPVPVKTPAEIEAQKGALDAAKARQLDPGAPKPLQPVRARKPAAAKAGAPAAAD